MLSTFSVLMIAAFLCLIMLLVMLPLLRSGVPGVKAWAIGNVLGLAAFLLYAFGRQLPPVIAYEVANGVGAAALAAILVGFRQFLGRPAPWAALAAGIALFMAAIAFFHYRFDSFALRTLTVAVFQGTVALLIGCSAFQAGKAGRSRYPYLFTEIMAGLVVAGHAARSVIYLAHTGELTSLLQPAPWNVFFLGASALIFPVLTLGALMMVHDKAMEQAELAANKDFLTGAWSRRAFFDLAGRELSRARRSGQTLALLLIDVDNFKTINDTAGHAAGDRVLTDLVVRGERAIRGTDFLARIGGEEFAVLLPDTDRASALAIAERIRAALDRMAATPDTENQPQAIGYTVSIGLAVLRDTQSLEELLQQADAALYHAKASGRNLVCCEDDVTEAGRRHAPAA